MRFDENILAVIVLYKTKLSDSKTFISLTESLKSNDLKLDLVVYDNSPEYNVDIVLDLPSWQITYIPDISNSGVSKAYNKGVNIAASSGKKWIMFFDQDTSFPENTMDVYIEAIKSYPEYKLFAPVMLSKTTIISPCRFKFMRGSSLKSVTVGVNTLKNVSVINCGMCVDIDAFKKNGGYNELLKLDFSDHEFIKRFKDVVSNEFVLIDLKVQHELSTESKNSLNSDLVRFDYYLEGGKIASNGIPELLFFKFNSTMRMLKLTLRHQTYHFIMKLFKFNNK